ncbi:MAG: serine hydrolase [Mesorhizobium sp.]|uniref:serine hydrolase n=1 Tax=Mesorhizobium sp. TaxID=1871066 RepID=UPI000FE8FD23|nr:serine hydrolase [Mesorhizobium sp.]RWL93202.1 MAG: serine hydrolase [Mesorhizobium sp.]
MLRSLILTGVLCLTAVAPKAEAPAPVPSDAKIRAMLVDRIDTRQQGVGIVVGVIGAEGRRIVPYGRFDRDNPRVPDGDTVFEIGSVTKVFTALLLAEMARQGEVALGDPVSKYLPAGVRVPERGRAITLADLSTHISGLPRMPTNFAPRDPRDPYADYTPGQLYDFLSGYRLPRDVGAEVEYSNVGVGLLGQALAHRAGVDYETLVRTRIIAPLGLHSTAITLPPELQARLATGHNAGLEAVPNWTMPTLAGAGALRSTANDLLTFLGMAMGYDDSPLRPAMDDMLAVRRSTGRPGDEVVLGWSVMRRGDDELVWHNGGTGGYNAFVGFLRKARIGVVVLSNTAPDIGGTEMGVADIGLHLLDPALPLSSPPKPHHQVAVDPALFDAYVGRYQLAPGVILTVWRDGNRLLTQASGEKEVVEIFPESEKDFFVKLFDGQITFEVDGSGRAVGLILHRSGRDQRAERIAH